MSDVIYARVMNRIGSESEWIADNPIILDGEIALVRFGALIKFKVGDGLTAFNALTYNVFDPTNFGGLATAATDPGSPTSPIMFLLTPGTTYPYFKDSGGVAITVPVSISGNPVISAYGVVLGAVTSTIYNTTVISLVEYTKFTDIFKISPHTETPVSETINATPLSNDNPTQAPSKIYPQNTAIVRNSGAVEYYNHDEIYAFPANRSSTPTWASNNYMFVNWKTAAAGFSKDGILTEVKVGTIAFGASGSKIQAFVLRPISLGAGTFSLVSAIGEIPSEVSNTEWHVFRGLSVQVKAGDMIGIRGIAACPIFYTGFPASDNYTHIIAQFPGDTTLAALNGGIAAGNIVQAPQTGRVFQIQAYISDADPLASNVPGGNLKLDTAGNIPKRIGKLGDMQWKQKKLIWIGTSIPAQWNTTSYPVQVAAYLDAIVYNEAIGSSGICWDGTRNLSLSATIAELTASFPGYEYNSYQNKIIGRAADLLVFDHGHNDTQYMTGVIIKTVTGTYTSVSGSTAISGFGTKFVSEIKAGDKLFTNNNIFIGYVQSVTNDYNLVLTANSPASTSNAVLKSLNMDRTTFYGASNYVIQKAFEDNPSLRLFFITPYNRYTYSGTQTTNMDTTRKQIQLLAEFYNAPVCDMMKLAGVNINNFATKTIDGIHPTQDTADKIAIIAQKAISNYDINQATQGDLNSLLTSINSILANLGNINFDSDGNFVIADALKNIGLILTKLGVLKVSALETNTIKIGGLNFLPSDYAKSVDVNKLLSAITIDSEGNFTVGDVNGFAGLKLSAAGILSLFKLVVKSTLTVGSSAIDGDSSWIFAIADANKNLAFGITNGFTVIAKSIKCVDATISGPLLNSNGAKYLNSIWNGKSIFWMGTSIPTRGLYPENSAIDNGAICINKAVSSSSIRKANNDGSYTGIQWYTYAYALTHTNAEKQYIIDNWSTIRTSLTQSPPTTLTSTDQAFILSCSYENRLLPYLNGTFTMPDLFVLDHGFNDWFNLPGQTISNFTTMPSTRNDKNTFIGAMNFIIDLILQYNPRARIFLSGHYENTRAPAIATAQKVIADYWQIPILKLWELTMWSTQLAPGSQALWSTALYSPYASGTGGDPASDMPMYRVWLPDGIHPHTDTTGKSISLLSNIVGNFINSLK